MKSTTRTVSRWLSFFLSDSIKGRVDYYLFPKLHTGFGGPLNGSKSRQDLLCRLMVDLPLSSIVETGTFRGTSTAYFANFGVPVFSVEYSMRFYAFAAQRLRGLRNVHLACADSRDFLRQLVTDQRCPKEKTFFYLDAHWNEDLPLLEEVKIIFDNWKDSVVLIDDFKVPDDKDYQFDAYSEENQLDLKYITRASISNLGVFFPSLPGCQESGMRRGWVAITNSYSASELLSTYPMVRSFNQVV